MSNEWYKKSKFNVIEILNSKTEIEHDKTIPNNDEEFTFENGIQSWVGAMFIDIRNSTDYFKRNKNERVARVMRAFTSEIISYLCQNQNYREIGIRGDCIYAIYACPYKKDIETILSDASYINTFQKMFQKVLYENNFSTFKVGIGLACSEDLVIKAGKFGTGISNKIWLGNAAVDASNLSSLGNKNNNEAILLSPCFYYNIKDFDANKQEKYSALFTKHIDYNGREYYGGNIVETDFNDWIEHGMK